MVKRKSDLIDRKTKQNKSVNNDRKIADQLLRRAYQCWNNLDEFRKKRERHKRYAYNDQWSDKIEVKDDWGNKRLITEREHIQTKGNVALQNNLIRRLMKTVKGSYLSQMTEAVTIARDRKEQRVGEMMANMLQCNNEVNQMRVLVSNMFEEFLLSGVAIEKEVYAWNNGMLDCWSSPINPSRIFFTPGTEDPRHWDIDFIGCIHDIPYGEMCSAFASNPSEAEKIKKMYNAREDHPWNDVEKSLTGEHIKRLSFLNPLQGDKHRVYEIWDKRQRGGYRCHDILDGDAYTCSEDYKNKYIDAENAKRIQQCLIAGIPEDEAAIIETEWCVETYWHYTFLTPHAEIIQEGDSSYAHKSHPFTIKIYPFIDGEAHSFVEDIIDQQRYINRLITMQDFIMRSSAKGVLMFPEESMPDDMSLEEIAETWASYDGIIFYKPKAGIPMPQQISSNSTNIGIHELLSVQLKLMEEISGIQGALQGKSPNSGTAASLYAQQTQNASTLLVDLFESFKYFYLDFQTKKVQNIQQYYTEKRIINIAGDSYKGVKEYDPEKTQGIKFDLSMSETSITPVYRMMQNDLLMEMMRMGAINVKQMLEAGSFAFADQLLQTMNVAEEEGQLDMNPTLMNQVNQQAKI